MSDFHEGEHITPAVRLVRPLGEGGMGKVWLGEHVVLRTPVVVKFMSEELAAREDSYERFSLEATAASQVRSPHVVQVLDHGFTAPRGFTQRGVPYIVMEFLEGRDLRHELMERGRISPPEMAVIVAQVCKALARAYKRGIIHRDIKPENIFLCDHGGDEFFVKLLDFGIAKTATALSNATATGTIMGTLPYMSPEQLVGSKEIDHRTDLWALGVVTFEALTGTLPFDAENVGQLTLAVHAPYHPKPSERFAPLGTSFDDWFRRACAVQLSERFANASEMADSFRDALAAAMADDHVETSNWKALGSSSDADSSGAQPALAVPPTSIRVRDEFKTMIDPPRFPEGGHGPIPTTVGLKSKPAPLRKRPLGVILAGAVLVGVLVGVGAYLLARDSGNPPAEAKKPSKPPHEGTGDEEASTAPSVLTSVMPSTSSTTPEPSPSGSNSAKIAKPGTTPGPKASTKPSSTSGRNDAAIF